MKKLAVLVVFVAAGAGIGIAQAGGFHQVASAGQEFVPEDNWSGTDWQAGGSAKLGVNPGIVSDESWMKEYGND